MTVSTTRPNTGFVSAFLRFTIILLAVFAVGSLPSCGLIPGVDRAANRASAGFDDLNEYWRVNSITLQASENEKTTQEEYSSFFQDMQAGTPQPGSTESFEQLAGIMQADVDRRAQVYAALWLDKSRLDASIEKIREDEAKQAKEEQRRPNPSSVAKEERRARNQLMAFWGATNGDLARLNVRIAAVRPKAQNAAADFSITYDLPSKDSLGATDEEWSGLRRDWTVASQAQQLVAMPGFESWSAAANNQLAEAMGMTPPSAGNPTAGDVSQGAPPGTVQPPFQVDPRFASAYQNGQNGQDPSYSSWFQSTTNRMNEFGNFAGAAGNAYGGWQTLSSIFGF